MWSGFDLSQSGNQTRTNNTRQKAKDLNPNIKNQILISCPYKFSVQVVGRICWRIN